MSTIRRIDVQKLEVGMYISEFSDEWAVDSRLKGEGLISRQVTVDRIVAMGISHVYIDVSKGKDGEGSLDIEQIAEVHRQEIKNLQKEVQLQVPRVSFAEAREEAGKIRSQALLLMDDTFKSAKMGANLDIAAIDSLSSDIIRSLTDNHNALATMLRLREQDQYLLEHSFSVAVLMGMLARSLGYSGEALQPLVMGGLLHDIGKIKVPPEILNKPARLDLDEWEIMKRHVDFGLEILSDVPGVTTTMKKICAEHHERLDGTGYPYKLPEEKISIYGKMGAVVDVYDAITADRCYHKGMLPTVALRKMLEWSGDRHLEKNLVYQLIRCISVYPPGSLVELTNGHAAIVQEINALEQTRPVVAIVFDIKRRTKLPRRVLDLSLVRDYGEVLKPLEPASIGLSMVDIL